MHSLNLCSCEQTCCIGFSYYFSCVRISVLLIFSPCLIWCTVILNCNLFWTTVAIVLRTYCQNWTTACQNWTTVCKKCNLWFIILVFVPGDEILAVNSKPLHGLSHKEAIDIFKQIRSGSVLLHIGRRLTKKHREKAHWSVKSQYLRMSTKDNRYQHMYFDNGIYVNIC